MKTIILFLVLTVSLTGQTNIQELVDIKEIIPDIILDIKYATTDNFVKQKLYASDVCYLSLGAARQLKLVQDTLRTLGYSLKIFDGYRPRAIQWLLWQIYPDSNYVADPKKGSRHNRGSAIDLTIVEISTGKELDMGTPFDFFGEEAGHKYTRLKPEALQNRRLLREMMTEVGNFEFYSHEWWHYNYKEGADFPLKEYQTKN